jgi:hypothetical protein
LYVDDEKQIELYQAVVGMAESFPPLVAGLQRIARESRDEVSRAQAHDLLEQLGEPDAGFFAHLTQVKTAIRALAETHASD